MEGESYRRTKWNLFVRGIVVIIAISVRIWKEREIFEISIEGRIRGRRTKDLRGASSKRGFIFPFIIYQRPFCRGNLWKHTIANMVNIN